MMDYSAPSDSRKDEICETGTILNPPKRRNDIKSGNGTISATISNPKWKENGTISNPKP